MEEMNQKNRPTCVTVIGYACLFLGIAACFSSVMGLIGLHLMDQIPPTDPSKAITPRAIWGFSLLALLSIALAVFQVVASVSFLRLRAWARASLEALIWFYLVSQLVCIGWFVVGSVSMPSDGAVQNAVVNVGLLVFFVAPMVITVKILRSDTVKDAMTETRQPVTPPYCESAPKARPGDSHRDSGDMMSEEKRPTCVTVIGWAWILIGAFLLFPVVFFWPFEIPRTMDRLHSADVAIRSRLWIGIISLLLAQAVLGASGLMAAIMFLKRRSWARTMLEVLTWFCLTVTAGFGVVWVWMTVRIGLSSAQPAVAIFVAILGAGQLAFFGVPMAVMLLSLRSETVRNAMKRTAEPAHPAEHSPAGTPDGR